MSLFEDLTNDPVKMAKALKRFKELKKARREFYANKKQNIKSFKGHIDKIKGEGGISKEKTMQKVFSIPLEVYMSDQDYWDEIIKTKDFKKHPEWMTGGAEGRRLENLTF